MSYRNGSGDSDGRRLAVGDRFPWIDILHPATHTLLVIGPEPGGLGAVLNRRTDLVHVERVTDGRTRIRWGVPDGLLLVRPDGYVALLGAGVGELGSHLDETCGTKGST